MNTTSTQPKAFISEFKEEHVSVIRKGLEYINFANTVKPSSKIFIKPNLTFPVYQPGVMTSPQAIEAAILALKDYTSQIYIGDADSGGYNRFSMDQVYQETGIVDFASKHGVKIVNLSNQPHHPIHFQYKGKDFSLDLPRLLTDEIDFTITMPVPKIHCNSGVSLTFKNQWGCIPENRDRLRLHPYLEHVVFEVNRAVKSKFAIVDGTYGLNINGPLRGEPVELGWILIADHIGAAARIACNLMQVKLENIPHLRYIKKIGWIPELEEISINGDPASFRKVKFYLKRKWTDLPGVLAYNSPTIAYLGYFSPLAGLLHKILYWFREPFYDYKKYVIKR